MRNVIYLLLLSLLFACSGERKPLEILPMTGNNPSIPGIEEHTVPGFFYVKNFSDNKKYLNKLLHYIKDTIRRELPFDAYSSYLAEIHKKNRGIEFEGGEAYSEKQDVFRCSFNRKNTHLFNTFRTWSKLWINKDDFSNKCDYKYNIVRKNKVAVVYFNYKEFNTDVWQKFLNIVFYNRSRVAQEDRTRYKLHTPDQRLAWHNWSAPTRYSLLNLQTKEIECVIEYPLADNYEAFTMEIH